MYIWHIWYIGRAAGVGDGWVGGWAGVFIPPARPSCPPVPPARPARPFQSPVPPIPTARSALPSGLGPWARDLGPHYTV